MENSGVGRGRSAAEEHGSYASFIPVNICPKPPFVFLALSNRSESFEPATRCNGVLCGVPAAQNETCLVGVLSPKWAPLGGSRTVRFLRFRVFRVWGLGLRFMGGTFCDVCLVG